MNVIKGFPPNYDKIKLKFPVTEGTVYTYGSDLFAPYFAYTIPDDLMIHEETHSQQQFTDPEGWWDRYIADPDFRLRQELHAYRAQYQFFSKHHSRNDSYKLLTFIAHDLSGELYGNIIDYDGALLAISS